MAIKKDGAYDGRTSEGRQSKGKTNKPKTTVAKMEHGLKNNKKSGKIELEK
jgi:hypothetical protein